MDRMKADLVLQRLADGESLNAICNDADMPAESTVRSWARDDVDGFAAKYARAREIGYDRLGEEILRIADTPQLGEIRTAKADGGEEVKYADMIEHRRLQVDTRKWMLAKMLPKKYGDKIDHNVTADLTINWPVPASRVER